MNILCKIRIEIIVFQNQTNVFVFGGQDVGLLSDKKLSSFSKISSLIPVSSLVMKEFRMCETRKARSSNMAIAYQILKINKVSSSSS